MKGVRKLTERERYIQCMTFGTPDKIPLTPGGPRESTLRRWYSEGLPPDRNYFAFVCDRLGIRQEICPEPDYGFFLNSRMIPIFEEKVISHTNGHYIVQDWMGAVTEISDRYDYTYIRSAKDFVTRKWHSFPVKTREDWQKMRSRYDPDDPERLPADLPSVGFKLKDRKKPLSVNVNGPFWQLREWLGMENLCMAFLDDPDFVEEMTDFWCEFILALLRKVLPHIQPDCFRFSEDMAYKAHSMISPAMTRRFLQPVYLKWLKEIKKYGVPVVDVDSDGFVGELIPVWIESGINACDPMEVAAYNDIVHCRYIYGRSMAYSGGIDKRAIAAGGETMKNEVLRVVPPLLRDGGFIPSCDHGVPPDISLQNYTEYTMLLAQLTGWL